MTSRQGAWLAVVAAALLAVPFLGKAYHNDEPFFLKSGRHILTHPLDPLGFEYTWYGTPQPALKINTTPPVLLYSAAAALALGGQSERLVRLCLLPYDLCAAFFLYLLAARFLKRPLLPVLIVLAGPAWLLNMGHVMAEKPAMAFGLAGLCLAVRGADVKRGPLYLAGAGVLALALLSKYIALVFLPPALIYGLRRGVPKQRLAAFAVLAVAPVGATALWYAAFNHDVIARAWSVTADSSTAWWASPSHKLRSLLAFTGGCAVAPLFWAPLLVSRRMLLVCLAAGVLLFTPLFDLAGGPGSSQVDRLTGALLSASALCAAAVVSARRFRAPAGWSLWASWLLTGVLLQAVLYWSVMARIVLFFTPPLVFLLAEALEASPPRFPGLARGGALAAALALGLSMASVDYKYAAAQKEFSLHLADRYLYQGHKVWYSGYMGLQHYLEERGARGLDSTKGGWDLAGPGDCVAVAEINSALKKPARPRAARVETFVIEHPLPIRVISGFTGEAGFYSNVWGYLPFSFSREPLEIFRAVELQ